MLKLGFLFDSY